MGLLNKQTRAIGFAVWTVEHRWNENGVAKNHCLKGGPIRRQRTPALETFPAPFKPIFPPLRSLHVSGESGLYPFPTDAAQPSNGNLVSLAFTRLGRCGGSSKSSVRRTPSSQTAKTFRYVVPRASSCPGESRHYWRTMPRISMEAPWR